MAGCRATSAESAPSVGQSSTGRARSTHPRRALASSLHVAQARHRASLLAVRFVVLAVAIACPGLVAAAATSGTPKLDKIVLRASQVGPGYKFVTRPDSRCVQSGVQRCATLDLCGANFPSEKLRTARLQLGYRRAGKTTLSNEVVTYRPGGAQTGAARDHVRAYPLPHRTDPRVSTRTHHRPASAPRIPGCSYLLRSPVNGVERHVYAIVIYQVKGNVLSGIYTDGRHSIADQQRLALHAAEQSAGNLKRGA